MEYRTAKNAERATKKHVTEAQEEVLSTQMLQSLAVDDKSYVGAGMDFVRTFSTINVTPRSGSQNYAGMCATQDPALIFFSGKSKDQPTQFEWPCMNAVFGCHYIKSHRRVPHFHQETYSIDILERKCCTKGSRGARVPPVRVPTSSYLTCHAIPTSMARTVVRIETQALAKNIDCVGRRDPNRNPNVSPLILKDTVRKSWKVRTASIPR